MAEIVRVVPRKKLITPEPGVTDRSQYLSRAVTKSLEILELLQESQTMLSLNEIARTVQLSKTSALRLLYTLEASGYLVQPKAGAYDLAPEVRKVVASRLLIRLMKVATPVMTTVVRDLRETISLAALFENRCEVIAVEESPQTIKMTNVVGHILPPHASALAKVLTAYQPEERREKLLRSCGVCRFTEHTIMERAELKAEYEKIRAQGYAVDREESMPDGCCFSAPIMGPGGEVPASLSVSLPLTRLRNSVQEEMFIGVVRTAASMITEELLN